MNSRLFHDSCCLNCDHLASKSATTTKPFGYVLSAIALLLLLAGCGELGQSESKSTPGLPSQAAAPDLANPLTKTLTVTPPASPVPGGIVRVNVDSKGKQVPPVKPTTAVIKKDLAADGIVRTSVDSFDEVPWPGPGVDPSSNPDGTHSGQQLDGNTATQNMPVMSYDGMVVAFESTATSLDLLHPVTNAKQNIFVHNLITGATTRIMGVSGAEPDGDLSRPAISGSGEYLTFESMATNLLDGDTNSAKDVFRYKISNGQITRISVYTDGKQSGFDSDSCTVDYYGKRVAFIGRDDLTLAIGEGPPVRNWGVYVKDLDTNEVFVASTSDDGTQRANTGSLDPTTNVGAAGPVISQNGKHVAYCSWATNLISTDDQAFHQQIDPDHPGSYSDNYDIYQYDLPGSLNEWLGGGHDAPRTSRVSVNVRGERGNDRSGHPSISWDGRYVAYWSQATNLMDAATYGVDYYTQYFLLGDAGLADHLTRPVQIGGPWDTGRVRRIYRFDALQNISNPNQLPIQQICSRQAPLKSGARVMSGPPARLGDSQFPVISANGQWVTYSSLATDLENAKAGEQAYVCKLDANPVRCFLASLGLVDVVGNGSSRCGGISSDGRYFALTSDSSNLVLNDSNGLFDVFVRANPWWGKTVVNPATLLTDDPVWTVLNNQTRRVSKNSAGLEANGNSGGYVNVPLSAGTAKVAFSSLATNLVSPNTPAGMSHIYVKSYNGSGTVDLVSCALDGTPANGPCTSPSISRDDRYVAFASNSTNLVDGAGGRASYVDIFVKDRLTGLVECVSLDGWDGISGNGCFFPFISADGRYVLFGSRRALVPEALPFSGNLYLRDRVDKITELISVAPDGSSANYGGSSPGCITPDGRYIVFTSDSTNLVADDHNEVPDVFVRDRQAGVTERVSVDSYGKERYTVGSFGADSTATLCLPSITDDGRFVVFNGGHGLGNAPGGSAPIGQPDGLYLRDRTDHLTNFISDHLGRGGGGGGPTISADGRTIATTPFVYDTATGIARHVCLTYDDIPNANNNYSAYSVCMGSGGWWVAFTSNIPNLVYDDNNNAYDIFSKLLTN